MFGVLPWTVLRWSKRNPANPQPIRTTAGYLYPPDAAAGFLKNQLRCSGEVFPTRKITLDYPFGDLVAVGRSGLD
jgi:hypothetical protein